jgi:uncharacterized protein YjiS (DUF1127 family)
VDLNRRGEHASRLSPTRGTGPNVATSQLSVDGAPQSPRAADESILRALSVLACAPHPFTLTTFKGMATICARRWAATKALLVLWRQRHHSRRELLELSALELHDIGFTRSDALVEAGKPFWR